MTENNGPTNPKIVLADDEQFIAIAYKDGLQRAGYDVAVAHNGREALEQIVATDPDIILLDLMMPELNGFDVLKALQTDDTYKKYKSIPVIILSNLNQPADESETLALGAVDYVVKADVSLKDLITHIQAILTR